MVRNYSIVTVDADAWPTCHHRSVIALFQILLQPLVDLIALTTLAFRQRRARAAGPIAQGARYDSRLGLIAITLEGGCEFAFPVALAEGLADAPRSKLRKIKISPNGLGLHWPLPDADLYVPGLIEGAFGSRRWMQQIGKLGRSSRSSVTSKDHRTGAEE